MKVSRRVIFPLALLLGLLLVVEAVVTEVDTEEPDKISEGLGFKHQLDEEEAGRKAGEAVKSARKNTQETVDGELCTCVLVLLSFSFYFVCN
jgi:hypothetical protein